VFLNVIWVLIFKGILDLSGTVSRGVQLLFLSKERLQLKVILLI
jgi:hypothetical protein